MKLTTTDGTLITIESLKDASYKKDILYLTFDLSSETIEIQGGTLNRNTLVDMYDDIALSNKTLVYLTPTALRSNSIFDVYDAYGYIISVNYIDGQSVGDRAVQVGIEILNTASGRKAIDMKSTTDLTYYIELTGMFHDDVLKDLKLTNIVFIATDESVKYAII